MPALQEILGSFLNWKSLNLPKSQIGLGLFLCKGIGKLSSPEETVLLLSWENKDFFAD
jgi:hypothetical protein